MEPKGRNSEKGLAPVASAGSPTQVHTQPRGGSGTQYPGPASVGWDGVDSPEASQHWPLLSQGRTIVGTGAWGAMPRARCCHAAPTHFPPLLTRVWKVLSRLCWAGREAPFLGKVDANQTSLFVSIIEQTYGLHSLWNNLGHVIRKSNCSEKKSKWKKHLSLHRVLYRDASFHCLICAPSSQLLLQGVCLGQAAAPISCSNRPSVGKPVACAQTGTGVLLKRSLATNTR